MQQLPDSVLDFNKLVQYYFNRCYDLKHIVTTDNHFEKVWRLGLTKLMKHYGLRVNGTHNAACDAEMTVRLFLRIKNLVNNLEDFSNQLWFSGNAFF